MRRPGLVFLAVGLVGFLIASGVHSTHPEVWQTARWMLMGVAVMGVVFTVFPGKRA
ncbi:MAG TPA: hypothetical protein VGG65_00630 [Thermoanaerobaculia bacterium]|jgi:hypothetical protein